MKVIPISLMMTDVYGRDAEGNIWKMTEGYDETWQLFLTAEEARKRGLI